MSNSSEVSEPKFKRGPRSSTKRLCRQKKKGKTENRRELKVVKILKLLFSVRRAAAASDTWVRLGLTGPQGLFIFKLGLMSP